MIIIHMQNIDISEILDSIDQINTQEKQKLTLTMDFVHNIDNDINQIAELQASDTTQYTKAWGKLDKQQKINRLMSYVNKLSLKQDKALQLRKLLIDGVVNKRLTRKADVDYCQETGEILRIPKLKQQIVGNRNFYLIGAIQHQSQPKMMISQQSNQLNVTSKTNISVTPMKKLDLIGMSSLFGSKHQPEPEPEPESQTKSQPQPQPKKRTTLSVRAKVTDKTKLVTKKLRSKVKPIIHIKHTNGK